MPHPFSHRQLPLFIIVGLSIFGLAGWQQNPAAPPKLNNIDTIPGGKERKVKDFDDVLQQLDKSGAELENNFKNFKIPNPPVPQIPPIDIDKIKMDVEKAVKEIDVQKIKAEVQASLAKVDLEKVKAQIAEVEKVDFAKIETELKEMKPKIEAQLVQAQKEIEKVKKIDIPEMNKQLERIKPQMENSLQEARKGIEKAKKEIEAYKSFVDDLDRDGLINKKENYTIEYNNRQLIINGKTQPSDIFNKYQNFLKNRNPFTIKKDTEGLHMNNND